MSHLITNWQLSLLVFFSLSTASHGTMITPSVDAVAEALLHGVVQSRSQYDLVTAVVRIEYPDQPSAHYHVEQDGRNRRCEIMVDGKSRESILFDGEIYHGYRRKQNEDVHIYDVRRSVGVRGDIAFDPRLLGLSDILPNSLTLEQSLWKTAWKDMKVVGQEKLGDVEVWRVSIPRGNTTAEFWIEEPSFRVHRKSISTGESVTTIDSKFDSKESLWPFPSDVRCVRTGGLSRGYVVEEFSAGENIPLSRFSLESFGLPLNTAIVDYRVNRNVGYWNGESISPNPQYSVETPVAPNSPKPRKSFQGTLIAINIVLVLIAAVWFWKRRSVRDSQST